MKRQRYPLLFAVMLGFLVALATGGLSVAGNPPVPAVWELFPQYTELEDGIRSGEWQRASGQLKEFEERYRKVADQLKPVVDAATIHKFYSVIDLLKKKLALKDREQAEKPLVMLQNLLFDIMAYYDYPVPPGLMVASLWVQESFEYLERNNLAGISEEMEELIVLRQRITDGFKARPGGEENIALFFTTVKEVQRAVRDGKNEKVKKGLLELRSLLETSPRQ